MKKSSATNPVNPRTRSLEERLREAEETLEAIRSGHVDALVVQGPAGEQVFTLKGADHRYRQLVETMNEGALLVDRSGMILYGNARFAELVGVPLEQMVGWPLERHIADSARPVIAALLRTGGRGPSKAERERQQAGGQGQQERASGVGEHHGPRCESGTRQVRDSMQERWGR